MILTILILATITTSLSIYLAATPIILGINILLIALLIASTYAIYIRSWYAFILFLIYVGGILVIFVYFLAISPNQQIPYSKIASVRILSFLVLLFLSQLFNFKVTIINNFTQGRVILYIIKNAPTLIILALILLLAIIIVVKITNRSTGPLRPFNYV